MARHITKPLVPRAGAPDARFRALGTRRLRALTALGIVILLGLTGLFAALAYDVSSTDDAAHAAARAQVLTEYQRQIAAQDAQLATLNAQRAKLTRARLKALSLAATRRAQRAVAIALMQQAQASAAAQTRTAAALTGRATVRPGTVVPGTPRTSTPAIVRTSQHEDNGPSAPQPVQPGQNPAGDG